jgi:molybdopterin molybdotransferase
MMVLNVARKRIMDATPVLDGENVHILEALKRVLFQDIVVAEDFPTSDISAMDGYAVHHASLKNASEQKPVFLEIIGESPAGRPFTAGVGDGQAVQIMTGGVVPSGADTVIRLEKTVEQDGSIICTYIPEYGEGIRFRGENLRKGQIVLRAGDVIGPVEVGVLATLGRAYAEVHQKPTVAIIATGNELKDFHEPSSPHKVMCSNMYALAAQVLASGGVPHCLGIVNDDLDQLQSVFSKSLRADVIITSGGLSMGKYDLVQKAMASLGMDMRFSTIFAKPGKPSIFGTIDQTLVFGLPGNPSAAMLSFEQFIKPALLKMMGHKNDANDNHTESHWRTSNGSISTIDSFAQDTAATSGQYKASLVPMGRLSPVHRKNHLQAVSTPLPDVIQEQPS